MHIPIKVDYGVRALVDLALHPGDGPVRAADIAGRTLLPEAYLAQVLHALNKSGFVSSHRGPQGGHTLAMDPSEVKLSAVMTCLGGTETLVRCLEDSQMCVHVPVCAQREVWRRVEDAVQGVLDSTSIADLVDRTRVIESAMRQRAPVDPLRPVTV